MPGQLLPAGGGGGRRVDHRPMGGHDPLRGACRMEREMLPVVEQLYADKKFKNMALLLNGTTVAYGYKNYGYRYGYHYGYGHYAK